MEAGRAERGGDWHDLSHGILPQMPSLQTGFLSSNPTCTT